MLIRTMNQMVLWHHPDHFRIVTLPRVADLQDAVARLGRFLATYVQD
ncbi:hypothetical protein GCM10020218_058880 [Dactylosporangium vinaceum]